MPVNPAARFKVVEVPTRAPGNCFTCKGTKNRPFIDTGLLHEYYRDAPDPEHDGNVYICSACIKDMYNTLVLADTDFDQRLEEARRAGVVEGLITGKKMLDDFGDKFVDTGAAFSNLPSSIADLLASHDGEDEPAEPENAEDANKDAEQGILISSLEGPYDLPNDRVDADLFG